MALVRLRSALAGCVSVLGVPGMDACAWVRLEVVVASDPLGSGFRRVFEPLLCRGCLD